MYFENGHKADGNPNYKSQHNRLAFFSGLMDLKDIIENQIQPKKDGLVLETSYPGDSLKYKRGELLVAGKRSQRESRVPLLRVTSFRRSTGSQ